MSLTVVTSSTYILPGQTPALTVVSQSNPSAGSDWTVTVPAGQTWVVESILAVLTTSATVANRTALLRITSGGTIIVQLPPAAAVTASTPTAYNWAPGVANVAVTQSQSVSTPPLPLVPGTVISSVTSGLQSGDQWSLIAFNVLVYT